MDVHSPWPRRIGIAIGITSLFVAGFAVWSLSTYVPAPVDPGWEMAAGEAIPAGSVTVRYTGTATLVFSDGDTTWMTDGWFSRPGPLELAFARIEPDLAAIEKGLARNEVTRAAAVFPIHSHFDHAMDAPEVARRTGALLLGSEATANIGRGWGLPESQIRVVKDREPIELGAFVLTPIESRHFQFANPAFRERALGNPNISAPLVPPVRSMDYRLGKAYALHVEHPKGSFLIQGSAGFIEGGLTGFDADVVFLGTGGLGSQTPEYREAYWRETVERFGPNRVIPIHWDSLTGPIEGPFRGPVRAMSFLSAGTAETLTFLLQKAASNTDIRFRTLPRYAEVALF